MATLTGLPGFVGIPGFTDVAGFTLPTGFATRVRPLPVSAAAALARAADAIGESNEYNRCLELLDDCDPSARAQLGLG